VSAKALAAEREQLDEQRRAFDSAATAGGGMLQDLPQSGARTRCRINRR
jgi:hypothetical protein